MPRVFKIGPYLVYFWSDEMEPLEPVHVHISQGEPEKNSTKVWLTKSGRALLVYNFTLLRGENQVPLRLWKV